MLCQGIPPLSLSLSLYILFSLLGFLQPLAGHSAVEMSSAQALLVLMVLILTVALETVQQQ